MTIRDPRDEYKPRADEWYEFDGDAELDKPAYWLARIGRNVTEWDERNGATTKTLHDLEEACGYFAEFSLDPDGPAEIRVGDTIRIVWGPCGGSRFQVATVRRDVNGDFHVTGDATRPLLLIFGQYEILSRLVA